MDLPIAGGLFSSMDRTRVPAGRVWDMLNASVENGIGEAGPGFDEKWRQAVGSTTGDRFWGGLQRVARYEDAAELLVVIQRSGHAKATLWVVDTTTWTGSTDSNPLWSGLDPSEWSFATYGEYVYALNEVDGMFRHKIGDSTSWERYSIQWASATAETSQAVFERGGSGVQYPIDALWGNGNLAGALTYVTSGNSSDVAPDSSSIDTSRGTLELHRSTDGSSETRFKARFIMTLTADLDVRKNRYWCSEIICESVNSTGGLGLWDNTRLNEEIRLDVLSGVLECYYHTSSGATVPSGAAEPVPTFWKDHGWRKCRVRVVLKDANPKKSSYYISAMLWIDFDESKGDPNFTSTDFEHVRKLYFGIPCVAGNRYNLYLTSPMVGGVPMVQPSTNAYASYDNASAQDTWDPATTYASRDGDVLYALTQYNHVSTDESGAIYKRVTAESGWGIPPVPGLPPLGVGIYISFGALTGGYDRFRLYRKRNSDGGKWYLIYEADGSASNTTILDARVDALNDPVPWGEALIESASKDFSTKNSAFDGTKLATWKGHMIIGSGREVYESYYDNPGKYVLPYRMSPVGAANTTDPAIGSTGWLSDNTSDVVQCLIAQDVLYGVGRDGVYVSIGDSAVNSTPFRKMPLSKGALSPMAADAHDGGILVGSQSGLYWYQAIRAIVEGNDTNYPHNEETKEVRKHWKRLLELGGDHPLIVRSWREEVWCVKGVHYLRRTRNLNWEFGEFDRTRLQSGALGGASAPYGTATAFATPIQTQRQGTEGELLSKMDCSASTSPVGFWIADIATDDALGIFLITSEGLIHEVGDHIRWHAGAPIRWGIEMGPIRMADRGKVTGVGARLRATEAISSSAPVRLAMEVYDGRDKTRTTTYDVTSEYFRVPDAQSNPGVEIAFGFGARTAAHQVLTVALDMAQVKP